MCTGGVPLVPGHTLIQGQLQEVLGFTPISFPRSVRSAFWLLLSWSVSVCSSQHTEACSQQRLPSVQYLPGMRSWWAGMWLLSLIKQLKLRKRLSRDGNLGVFYFQPCGKWLMGRGLPFIRRQRYLLWDFFATNIFYNNSLFIQDDKIALVYTVPCLIKNDMC